MCIGDLGKGWFDIYEKIYETYQISKLYRFMELVKYRMQVSVLRLLRFLEIMFSFQHTLRLLVENSLSTFINLVETPCLPCLDSTEDFVWGPALMVSPFISKAAPIFTLQLKMNEKGAYYSTKPETFQVI